MPVLVQERALALARLVRWCVSTDDAAEFCTAIGRVPDGDWPEFEKLLQSALGWRGRQPPLRQVKLARLRDEAARRGAARGVDASA